MGHDAFFPRSDHPRPLQGGEPAFVITISVALIAALTPLDRSARIQTDHDVAEKDFLAFVGRSVLSWTPDESNRITSVLQALEGKLASAVSCHRAARDQASLVLEQFGMWLVVVVPALERRFLFREQTLFRDGLDMAVTEREVKTPSMAAGGGAQDFFGPRIGAGDTHPIVGYIQQRDAADRIQSIGSKKA